MIKQVPLNCTRIFVTMRGGEIEFDTAEEECEGVPSHAGGCALAEAASGSSAAASACADGHSVDHHGFSSRACAMGRVAGESARSRARVAGQRAPWPLRWR